MTKIAVIGSIVADLAVRTPRVPEVGENLLAESFSVGPGGKGANAAVAVARAGAEAVLVGCIGDDDFGRMELAHLRQEGVNADGVVVDPEIATGVAFIMIDAAGENTILVVNGANDRLSAEAVPRALESHRGTLDGILINFEIPEAAVAAGVRWGKDQGIPVIVDAGPPRPYGPETWADCTVLTPNALETATLVGYPIQDDATAERAARGLLAAGPRAVVLKRGAHGATLLTVGREVHVPAFPVKVVDTTGAGDAFSATLTVAVAEGLPFEQAVRRANAAGALTVTRFGTMPAMPTRQEVDAFLARHETQEVTQ
jgi:ribokinase